MDYHFLKATGKILNDSKEGSDDNLTIIKVKDSQCPDVSYELGYKGLFDKSYFIFDRKNLKYLNSDYLIDFQMGINLQDSGKYLNLIYTSY
jgi:hypothetical protein